MGAAHNAEDNEIIIKQVSFMVMGGGGQSMSMYKVVHEVGHSIN